MKTLTILLLLTASKIMAQGNVAHFSIWKPKAGQEQNFENGYKQHLKWHQANGDKWSWYGWYVISGPRDGLFVDATFNHSWSDFDKSVKPAEDEADNVLHTYPFGDFQLGFKASNMKSLSFSDSSSLKSKFLRLVTLTVSDIETGKRVIEKLKISYQSNAAIRNLLTYKLVDGGNLSQFLLLFGFNSFEEFEKNENLQEELSQMENSLKVKTITSLSSEILVFKASMSLFPK
jgi:hypothetical protein